MFFRFTALFLVYLFLSIVASAQQRPHYTQYNVNNFVLNPAVGGVDNGIDIKVGYRTQWVGFEGAPLTQFVSANAPLNKISNRQYRRRRTRAHHGVGGYAFNDETGPLSKSGIYGSYAYHIPLNKKLYLSAGVFLGLLQNRLDLDKVILNNPNDPAVLAASIGKILPDGSLGMWLYADNFFVGVSMHQIFRPKSFSISETDLLEGRLFNHYFVHVGYNLPYKENWKIVPSILFKSVRPIYNHFDINLKVWYKDIIWGALSYRFQDATAGMVGYRMKNWLELSYSYDLTTSEIRRDSSGSHEVILGINIPTRLKILCPEKFW